LRRKKKIRFIRFIRVLFCFSTAGTLVLRISTDFHRSLRWKEKIGFSPFHPCSILFLSGWNADCADFHGFPQIFMMEKTNPLYPLHPCSILLRSGWNADMADCSRFPQIFETDKKDPFHPFSILLRRGWNADFADCSGFPQIFEKGKKIHFIRFIRVLFSSERLER